MNRPTPVFWSRLNADAARSRPPAVRSNPYGRSPRSRTHRKLCGHSGSGAANRRRPDRTVALQHPERPAASQTPSSRRAAASPRPGLRCGRQPFHSNPPLTSVLDAVPTGRMHVSLRRSHLSLASSNPILLRRDQAPPCLRSILEGDAIIQHDCIYATSFERAERVRRRSVPPSS
jgi:hypothetical protein